MLCYLPYTLRMHHELSIRHLHVMMLHAAPDRTAYDGNLAMTCMHVCHPITCGMHLSPPLPHQAFSSSAMCRHRERVQHGPDTHCIATQPCVGWLDDRHLQIGAD